MPNSQFIGPIFETGIQTPHYFNGRLLTAADLQAGQYASDTRQTWFGMSSGYGIIDGLEVTSIESNTKLHIAPGKCMNRNGQVIRIQAEISLPPLPQARQSDASVQADRGQFTSVKPQTIQPTPNASAGVYSLTVVPIADGYKGTAPAQLQTGNVVTGSSNNSIAAAPAAPSQWEVERFRLRLVYLSDSNLTEMYSADDLQGIIVNDSNRRNLVAHWCFGTLALQNLGSDPFNFQLQYGDADPLGSGPDLGDDDIPLATFHWNGSALTFVDMWSVRRRMIRDALAGPWQAVVSDKRIAMNQARFLQFQNHLNDLVQQSKNPKSGIDLSKRQLTDFFTFLPPFGFLPTNTSSVLTRITQGTGAQIGQPGGAPSNWWSNVAGGIANVAKVLDPLNWLNFLHSSVRTNATNIQSMQDQVTTLTEQIRVLQEKINVGQPPQNQGEGGGATTGGAAGTSGNEGNQPTAPLNQQQQLPFAPGQAVFDQILSLLNAKQNTGAENFDLGKSFAQTPSQVHVIGNDSISLLLQQSWYQDAIDLRPGQTGMASKVASILPKSTNLYLVAENLSHPTNPVYTIFHKAAPSTTFLDTSGGNQ